jgi:hypothetical protein
MEDSTSGRYKKAGEPACIPAETEKTAEILGDADRTKAFEIKGECETAINESSIEVDPTN